MRALSRSLLALLAAATLATPAAGIAVPAIEEQTPGSERAPSRAVETVEVEDNSFSPVTIEIQVGDTVRWEQTGSGQHSVTADDGSFDSHSNCPPVCMGDGDEFERTFEEAGTVRYYCKLHGGEGGTGMAGRVVVRSSSGGGDTDEASGSSGEVGSKPGGGGIAATGASVVWPFTAGVALIGCGLAMRRSVPKTLD